MHALVALAKEAVETYVREGRVLPRPEPLPPEWEARAGVFVSIKKQGQLRGCIGTMEPTRPSLAEEVIHNAIAAATEDPRFPPVTPWELEALSYSVDVLSPPEPVEDPSQLDPRRYGVVVKRGHRKGLLLPDLEGVDTVQAQLAIAKRKAGLAPDEPVALYRFTVQRYT